jgi:hypothetical protein
MNTLSFSDEFAHLKRYIQSTWLIPCMSTFESAAAQAFNQGLYDGRFWIDEHLTYRVGRAINRSNKDICPADKRRKTLGTNSLYDALCMFDFSLSSRFRDVYSSQLRWGKWDYSKNTSKLLNRLKSSFSLDGLEPIALPEKEQNALVKSYGGFPADGIRCFPTLITINYCNALYSRDEQGRSFVYTLFSAIYSHGLACAQEYNDRTLSGVLTSIYKSFRELPFDVANGDAIMAMARKHELMALLEAINPFEFSTSNDYTAMRKAEVENQAKWDVMSPEEQDAVKKERSNRASEIIAAILREEKDDVCQRKEQERLLKLDEVIEQFREKLTVFSV